MRSYLSAVDAALGPDLMIIGGGISRGREEFLDMLEPPTRIVPATLRTKARIIGATLACQEAT